MQTAPMEYTCFPAANSWPEASVNYRGKTSPERKEDEHAKAVYTDGNDPGGVGGRGVGWRAANTAVHVDRRAFHGEFSASRDQAGISDDQFRRLQSDAAATVRHDIAAPVLGGAGRQ